MVHLLIENGANVNAADFDGGTSLYWARVAGYDHIADLLRDMVARNCRMLRGNGPTHKTIDESAIL